MIKVKRKKRWYVIGGIVLLLVAFRMILPSIVLKYANNSLTEINGYYGHVNDIDISLYRGAYQLNGFYLNKLDSATRKQTKFFTANKIDLSIEWPALFNGRIVGELKFFSPELIFTKNEAEIDQVAKDTSDFRKILRDFMPLKVNRFEAQNGSVRYLDKTTIPKVDISLTDTYVLAHNLTNATDQKAKLPSSLVAKAKCYDGSLSLNMKLNAMAKKPSFDLSGNIKQANLVKLNDFFIAYGKFDISRGTFNLYSEFAADKGRFKGYVKPFVKDLEVKGTEDKKDSFFQKIKETVIDVVGDVLENPKKDQVATKIPVEGSFGKTTVGTWHAIWEVLKNAFIEALLPSVDNEIDISSPSENGNKKIGLEKYKTSDNHQKQE